MNDRQIAEAAKDAYLAKQGQPQSVDPQFVADDVLDPIIAAAAMGDEVTTKAQGDQNAADITSVSNTANQNAADIASLTPQVAQNASDISTAFSNITANADAIGSLQTEVGNIVGVKTPRQTVEASYSVVDSGLVLDCVPPSQNQDIVLPPIGATGSFFVTVYNETAGEFVVNIKDDGGSNLPELANGVTPNFGYTAYYDIEAGITDWTLIALKGQVDITLDVATYGNFDANIHASLPTSKAQIVGIGSEFLNIPPYYALIPNVPYVCTLTTVNTPSIFSQTVEFASGFDTQKLSLNRPATRSSANFGGAASKGFEPLAKLEDFLEILNTYCSLGHTEVDAGAPIVKALTGTGSEDLTPPTSPQPITGGDYAGYVKLDELSLITASGALSVLNGEIIVGAAGNYFSTNAWLDVSVDENNNNIGFIFGIERSGQILFSQRPTGTRASNGQDRTNVSGGGFINDLELDDKISVWVASEKTANLTIYDANLGLAFRVPSFLVTP